MLQERRVCFNRTHVNVVNKTLFAVI